MDIEDQAQETYLRLLRARDPCDVQNPQAYLLRVARWPTTPREVLIREAKAAPQDAVPLSRAVSPPAPEVTRRSESSAGLRVAFALAASLVVAVGVVWVMMLRPQEFQTKFGEQRSFLLDDGSRVTLNTASKIEVRLGKDRRHVHLAEGEALFEVAHDAARPFDVQTGPPMLSAADRVVITGKGAEERRHGINVSAAISWTQRQLVFEHRALGEVAEEFNRYNRGHIVTLDAQAGLQE